MMDFKHLPPHLRKLFETELKDLFNQKNNVKPFSTDAIHEMLDKAQAAIEMDRKDIEQKIQDGTIYKEVDGLEESFASFKEKPEENKKDTEKNVQFKERVYTRKGNQTSMPSDPDGVDDDF
tara:strand:- start:731 stop:1093 length:363 start_codon:yes stop_codon:yes gene_type:complete